MNPLLHGAIVHHGWRRAIQALRDETGQDLIEYGLLAGLIAIVAIGAVRALGLEIGAWWASIGQRIADLW